MPLFLSKLFRRIVYPPFARPWPEAICLQFPGDPDDLADDADGVSRGREIDLEVRITLVVGDKGQLVKMAAIDALDYQVVIDEHGVDLSGADLIRFGAALEGPDHDHVAVPEVGLHARPADLVQGQGLQGAYPFDPSGLKGVPFDDLFPADPDAG